MTPDYTKNKDPENNDSDDLGKREAEGLVHQNGLTPLLSEHLVTESSAGQVRELYIGKDVRLSVVHTGTHEWGFVQAIEPESLGGVIVVTDDGRIALKIDEHTSVDGGVISLCESPEEAGCTYSIIEDVQCGPSSAGFTSEQYSLSQALGVETSKEPGQNVVLIDLSEIHEFLETVAARGILVDPHIFTALYFVARSAQHQMASPRIRALSHDATPDMDEVTSRNHEDAIATEGRTPFIAIERVGDRDYAHRPKGKGAVIVPTLTVDRHVIFVEQERWPLRAVSSDGNGACIEWPAGLIADEGNLEETARAAARKELWEEASCDADPATMTEVACGPIVPKIGNEMLSFVVLVGAEQRDPNDPPQGLEGVGGAGVADENLTVHKVPLDGVHEWLEVQAAAGKHIDPKIYAGLYFLMELV